MSCSTPTTEPGARVRFPPPLVFLFAILLGVLCRFSVTPLGIPVDRVLRVLAGLLVLASGAALIASARVLFLRSGQSPIPWRPTPSLIFAGPFRFTRNPMYLGQTLIGLGLGVALDNLWICAFTPVALLVVHFIAVLPEERYLSEKFGDGYKQYLTRVRRYV
jgi:protein-S-isoprenylcysteine O-methyltransferase Ste14